MVVNTYTEVDELAKAAVLHAIEHENDATCLFETLSHDSILYKVYDDLYRRNPVVGSYFALHLKEKYEISLRGLT